jgi:hypothetical protein
MNSRSHLTRHLGAAACVAVFALIVAFGRSDVRGQGRVGGAQPQPQTGRTLAPVDLTGTWVSIVTEDWRWRMVTPPKGDAASIPVNAEARKVAASWNPDADVASGNQCKAYGVGGIMRQPGRVRISWQDDQTLKMEFDAGTQTRLLRFDRASQAPSERTLQGFSLAQWEGPGVGRGGATADGRPDTRVTGGGLLARDLPGGGGGGLRGGPPPRQQAQINRGGDLRIVTSNFREGYLRKNGIPYSEQASITEYVHLLPPHPNGDVWLHVVTIVEDPRYLTQPFYTSTSFRREPNDANFKATPCTTAAPLPVKATGK